MLSPHMHRKSCKHLLWVGGSWHLYSGVKTEKKNTKEVTKIDQLAGSDFKDKDAKKREKSH